MDPDVIIDRTDTETDRLQRLRALRKVSAWESTEIQDQGSHEFIQNDPSTFPADHSSIQVICEGTVG
jgi:hypothetical protein